MFLNRLHLFVLGVVFLGLVTALGVYAFVRHRPRRHRTTEINIPVIKSIYPEPGSPEWQAERITELERKLSTIERELERR